MAINSGSRIGPYEVAALIGEGGMGRVYRANDTNLGRAVAIKVLPDAVATDPERLARLQREAQVLARLNHPNIAAIYGLERSDGTAALVMELVEGPTLADRLAQGPMPIREALSCARQIAEALEAAHELGIIHRDIKPANIKVRADGSAKVLDFGLAKASEPTSVTSIDATASPTTTAMTAAGCILGTPAYMSPEQASGRPADKRSDLWAFGCVLYEMLAGKRAFDGANPSETLAAVLTKEADWDALPADTPSSIRRLLRRLLERDSRRRVPDIALARFEIEDLLTTPIEERMRVISVPRRESIARRMSAYVAVALMAAGLVAGAAWLAVPESEPRVARFTIPLGESEQFNLNMGLVAVSPDGGRIAYVANNQIYLRVLDQLAAAPLRGTEGASYPFFSPDGRWIGFRQQGQIKKLPSVGGSPVTICDAGELSGVTWGPDDQIVFGQAPEGDWRGIWKVSASGGTPQQLIKIAPNEAAYGPQLVGDGSAVLFTLATTADWSDATIVLQSLQTGQRHVLVKGATDGRYLSTGHLVYMRAGEIFAVPFDVGTRFVGEAVSVVANVALGGGGCNCRFGHFAMSQVGLVYVPRSAYVAEPSRTLLWVDRDGREDIISAPARPYLWPRLSPDQTRIAVEIRDQEYDIWIWDLERTTLTRVTSDPTQDSWPAWTPDSNHILFGRNSRDQRGLYRQAANGAGTSVQIMAAAAGTHAVMGVSPDGAQAIVGRLQQGYDLLLLPLAAGVLGPTRSPDGVGVAEPLIQTRFNEHNGVISPDGQWLAYQSDQTGQWEIYITRFPGVGSGAVQISTAGGKEPLFASTGEELFYRGLDDSVMSVTVTSGAPFRAGIPRQLVAPKRYVGSTGTRSLRLYDVSSDGRRFLMMKESERPDSLVLVQNWTEELTRTGSND